MSKRQLFVAAMFMTGGAFAANALWVFEQKNYLIMNAVVATFAVVIAVAVAAMEEK